MFRFFGGGLLMLALVGGILGGAYWMGGNARENKIRAALALQQSDLNDKAQEVTNERKETEGKVVDDFVQGVTQSAKNEKTIIKEIPVYVPQKSNDACVVPLGFVSVYDKATILANGDDAQDSAANGDQSPPAKAGDAVQIPGWIEQHSGMSLNDIAAVHAQNMKAFSDLRAMYVAVRHWANTSCYAP